MISFSKNRGKKTTLNLCEHLEDAQSSLAQPMRWHSTLNELEWRRIFRNLNVPAERAFLSFFLSFFGADRDKPRALVV